ncbi:permease prefix domain 1-containing protein [Fusibacter bizertensis]
MSEFTSNLVLTVDQLAIEDIKAHENVTMFIQKVLDQVYTEEEGQVIKDELIDHIFSLTEDYMAAGHGKEIAIRKALLQMGDPAEIGYSFTDYDGMKKRKFLRVGLKWLGVLIIILTFVVTVQLSGGFKAVFSDTSSSTSSSRGPDWFFVYYIFYFPFIALTSMTQGGAGLTGIPLSQLKISKEPLLILWSYKKRFPWEYFFLVIFFIPVLLVFVVLFASEGNNPIYAFVFLSVLTFSIWLMFHSEKYRIPKYVVLEEGIVVKNRLISWTAMDRISWAKDYMASSECHYKLIIEHVYRAPDRAQNKKNRYSGMTVKKNIDVNANQYRQLQAIMRERV